jgi:hypothetical protein
MFAGGMSRKRIPDLEGAVTIAASIRATSAFSLHHSPPGPPAGTTMGENASGAAPAGSYGPNSHSRRRSRPRISWETDGWFVSTRQLQRPLSIQDWWERDRRTVDSRTSHTSGPDQ